MPPLLFIFLELFMRWLTNDHRSCCAVAPPTHNSPEPAKEENRSICTQRVQTCFPCFNLWCRILGTQPTLYPGVFSCWPCHLFFSSFWNFLWDGLRMTIAAVVQWRHQHTTHQSLRRRKTGASAHREFKHVFLMVFNGISKLYLIVLIYKNKHISIVDRF